MGKLVNVVYPDQPGRSFPVPEEAVAEAIRQGGHVESADEGAAAVAEAHKDEQYGGVAGTAAAVHLGALRGISAGLSDLAFGSEETRELRDRHAAASLGAEIVGAVGGAKIPFAPAGLATRAGEAVASTIKGGGALTELGRAAAGAATEGTLFGAGHGVSELALSGDPVSVEHAASVIGSDALFGGVTGGVVGAAGKGLELGLRRAKIALDKVASKGLETGAEIGDDLTSLDRKGLRAAEKSELEAIEAARVPKRAEIADELKLFRKELKENKVWLATKGVEDAELKSAGIGRRTLDADRAMDKLLRDPKALAESPQAALKQLRVQESALDELVNVHGPRLRETVFAADTTGTRTAALDYASVALEKNRALQTKIAAVSGKATSPRLEAISDAVAGLSAAKQPAGSTIGEALGASALGHAVGALAGVPYLGQAVLAAKAIGGVAKKLGLNTAAAAERASKAVQTFLDVGAKVAGPAPIVASKVLASVAYGESSSKRTKKAPTLADSYRARANEITSLTAPGPDGKPEMRRDARAKMADRLAPLKAVDPLLADRIESTKARGVEFLASKVPRRPDLPGMGMGPDSWQPADMEMRGFARYVAAVEDPHGVIERLASGQVTPEDAETMRTVYPEMYADIQRQIMSQLGELQAKLPYQRRLALSIFSDIPVDPAMDPRVLAMLQGQFATEEGTEGGTQAPIAAPQFGSVSKEVGTPAQQRSQS